jgi:hypothetical protein
MFAISQLRARVRAADDAADAVEVASRVTQELRELREEKWALFDQRRRLEEEYGHREKAGVDISDIQEMLRAIHEAVELNATRMAAAEEEARKYGVSDDGYCYY